MNLIDRKFAAILCLIILLMLLFSIGCGKKAEELIEQDDPVTTEPYSLPAKHADNDHHLKKRFFQEPFRNLTDEMVQLERYLGIPLVIMIFPGFLTNDGQTALLGLEMLQHHKQGLFKAVIIPIEDRETIRPSIKIDPEGMVFLFRPDGESNMNLMDKYTEFFWDDAIIRADFPNSPPQRHHTIPFYWIVDDTGTIREKLIDYSDNRGILISEVAEVLDALLIEKYASEPITETLDTDITESSIVETEDAVR